MRENGDADPVFELRCFYAALAHNSKGNFQFWLSMPIRRAILWSQAFAHILDPDRVRSR